MPWTTADVEQHKKGLTAKQKKQWCRIANSVLAKCIAKGGTDKTCAPSAIKQANGVVMMNDNASNSYSDYKSKQVLDYDIKLTLHQKKAHIVAPVVMMVEGVHSGSQGPLLHEIVELGKFPASWNGIPIVIYHPTDEDGNALSANSPDIVDNEVVGRVYNTEVDGTKLKAEIWLDEDKLNDVAPDVLASINNNEEIEVSLGMFTENEMEEGDYNGEEYIGIAHNHRPDHLAILPDQTGACSCKDGCGIGANNKNKNNMERTKKTKTQEMLVAMNEAGYTFNKIGVNSDVNYQERINMVNIALRSLDVSIYNYLEELYDTYLIYCKSGSGEYKMYRQDYKINDGKVELVGAPVEVHKKVEYVVNTTMTRNKFSINNKKEDKNMPKGNDCPKCLEKINALIANAQSPFKEADRVWLLDQEETVLDKLAPVVIEKEKIVTQERTVDVTKLAPEDQAALAYGKKQLAEKRAKMTKGIQDNTSKEAWPELVLNSMTEEMLERVYNSVKKEDDDNVDYSLNGEHIQANAGEDDGMYPAGLDVK
jgi:hypothetical protein